MNRLVIPLAVFAVIAGFLLVGLGRNPREVPSPLIDKPVPPFKLAPEEAKTWLSQLGDPYAVSVMDRDGRVGIDFGVYGVPETFVIDRNGVIRFKQIGPVTAETLERKILPMVRDLQKS